MMMMMLASINDMNYIKKSYNLFPSLHTAKKKEEKK